jgi:hypothetical protein
VKDTSPQSTTSRTFSLLTKVSRYTASMTEMLRLSILDRDDVGLDRVFGRVRRVARRHRTFEEGTCGPLAVVAANAQDNRALLVHGIVSRDVGALSIVHRGQVTRLRIARLDRPLIRFAFHHRGDVVRCDGLVATVEMAVDSGKQPVFQVRHNPGAFARTVAPHFDFAEVNGFHVPIAGVMIVGFGVAVVEAASPVIVRAVEDGVLALGIVTRRDSRGVVVAVPGARSHVDAVDMVTPNRQWQGARIRQIVRTAGSPTGGCLGEIVAVPGLVVDDGDDAGRVSTECILRGGVGIASCAKRIDIGRRLVRRAPDLIKLPIVGGEKGSHRAVCGHTRSTGSGINVAGQRTGRPGRGTNKAQGASNETHTSNEYQQGSPATSA